MNRGHVLHCANILAVEKMSKGCPQDRLLFASFMDDVLLSKAGVRECLGMASTAPLTVSVLVSRHDPDAGQVQTLLLAGSP